MLNEVPVRVQKISSEKDSEHKVGQDTTRAISTPNNQNPIIFISGSQEFIKNLNILSNIKNKIETKEFLSSLKKEFYLDDTKSSNYVHN